MPKKILVIDNHPLMLKFMSGLLSKEGHEVLTAKDGLSALDMLKTFSPDVIFVDLIMPNISGDRLCRMIRSKPELRNTFLVVLSAIAADEDVDFAGFGADACIAKDALEKMGVHVLAVLEHLDPKACGMKRATIGGEDFRPREITRELLDVKRHTDMILETIAEGVVELTPESRIIYANPMALAIMNIPEEWLLGTSFSDLFTGPDRERVAEMLIGKMASDRCSFADSPLTIGEKQVALKLLSMKEENAGSLVILEDVTEKKRMEARLLQGQKMEALGTLAGGVAHDLNNVLGVIVGFSELLIMNLKETAQGSHASQILQAGLRAAAIVQDLLTMARRNNFTRVVLDLNAVINELRNSMEFAKVVSGHPEVEVRTELEPGVINVSGSEVHIRNTLINLLSNAAEAMPDGGVITIKTGKRYLDKPVAGYEDVKAGNYAALSVSDTGEGISASDLKHIFEPFYTRKVMGRSGTGLGLAVVWGTVKDHLGYIDVESTTGKGTTFTLYFPVTRQEISPRGAAISTAQYLGKGETILVVDDVEEQRKLAATMLNNLGYSVASVPGGEKAIEYLKQRGVDLVVLDMIMDPGMDGLETYTEILKLHPRQKAIIVSGFSETERVAKTLALGAGAYVRKPYMLEKLGLAVRKELDKSGNPDSTLGRP